MARCSILLRSDEAVGAREFECELHEDVSAYDIIVVGGMHVLVDEVALEGGRSVVWGQRLWKLRLRDRQGRDVGPGFIINEQRHFGPVETLILEGGERFRLVLVEQAAPAGFDGGLIVEPLPLDG